MIKQVSNKRFIENFGISLDDRERALDTMDKIESTYNHLDEIGESKVFFNLPMSTFLKAISGFTAGKRGLLLERYYARNVAPVRFTQTNEHHKGDLTDGKGRKHEVKTSRISDIGVVLFPGVRLGDEVDFFHFAIVHDGYIESHEVKRKHLEKLPLGDSRNVRAKQVQFRVGGPTHDAIAAFSTTHVMDDTTTGRRWDSMRFLDDAGVELDDLDHLVDSLDKVRNKVNQSKDSVYASKDELLEIHPLVERVKFGRMVQDWLMDHLERAAAEKAGEGDGLGLDGRHEVKYSALGSGKVQIHGIKPSEFDFLHIALHTGDDLEFFKLTKRSAQSFVRRFGKETNDGIFKVQGSSDGRAVKFLRRAKAVDINARVH